MEFTLDSLVQLVGSVGFPIAACAYMMIKMNKTVEDNTKVTTKLCNLIGLLLSKNEGADVAAKVEELME